MLLSDDYRSKNQALHETNAAYGTSGKKWAPIVLQIADATKSANILDYGCGKKTLEAALGFPIKNYDPCIPGLESPPDPADIVVCTDVLEHIEPECLDAVLDDIKRLTKRYALLVVATRPAKKVLSDGRNAHLIVQPARWWMEKIFDRFHVEQLNNFGGEFMVMVKHAS